MRSTLTCDLTATAAVGRYANAGVLKGIVRGPCTHSCVDRIALSDDPKKGAIR
jgi:hypothetical protein